MDGAVGELGGGILTQDLKKEINPPSSSKGGSPRGTDSQTRFDWSLGTGCCFCKSK